MEPSQVPNQHLAMHPQAGVVHSTTPQYGYYNPPISHPYGQSHQARSRTSSYMSIPSTVGLSQTAMLSQAGSIGTADGGTQSYGGDASAVFRRDDGQMVQSRPTSQLDGPSSRQPGVGVSGQAGYHHQPHLQQQLHHHHHHHHHHHQQQRHAHHMPQSHVHAQAHVQSQTQTQTQTQSLAAQHGHGHHHRHQNIHHTLHPEAVSARLAAEIEAGVNQDPTTARFERSLGRNVDDVNGDEDDDDDEVEDDDDEAEEEAEEEEEIVGARDEEEGDEDDEEEEDDDDDEVDEDVAEDIVRFEESFKRLRSRYRLINRIGEGTFSTVYKAEDLLQASHPTGAAGRKTSKVVAIKKIYVTSSPSRIFNEIQLLYDLREAEAVCPLITAFRHEDQVIIVLAYYPHDDFRDFFTKMEVADIKTYLRSLFTALRAVHEKAVIHRDIKPTNFLYSTATQSGVLVDFGLAERQGSECRACVCELATDDRTQRHQSSRYMAQWRPGYVPAGYPKHDSRPGRRANRAGTRGFRAPEVLFKCTAQTTAIDIWSVGVILLTFLTRRFPFFQSCDDVDALLELVNVFGKRKIRDAGLLHGQIFSTNIPSYRDYGPTFEKLVLWCRNSERDVRTQTGQQPEPAVSLQDGEREAIEFMELCFEFDPAHRITAADALVHPFLAPPP